MKWWEKTPSILCSDYENIYGLYEDMTRAEVRFLIDETSIPSQASILDLGCGTGRHAVRLAELGYSVTGLDISSDFLKVAAEKSSRSGLSIEWINKDMRDIPFKNRFDLVFIMFGAWGFFEQDHENEAVFKGIHRALKMDGHFVLDFFNRDWILSHFQPRHWAERENGYFLEERNFDSHAGRLNTETIFIKRDGQIIKWGNSTRAFTVQEIMKMLQQTGFSDINVYGNLEKQPYSLDTPRMLLHAQKTTPNKRI